MQATATTLDNEQEHVPVNSRNKVVVASLIGTAIEFFDFYIYATAAVIVFPIFSSRRAIRQRQRFSPSPPSPSPLSRVQLALRYSVLRRPRRA